MIKFTNAKQKWLNALLFYLKPLLVISCLISINTIAGTPKTYSRLYKVSAESAVLSIFNPQGSIKISAWEKPEIKVTAKLSDNLIEVIEQQYNNSIQLAVRWPKNYPIQSYQADFELSVPSTCTLDIKCLNGMIQISAIQGSILAETTEGEIVLKDLNSANIIAKSISGAITYNGNLAANGIYKFHSGENSIDLSLPTDSAFTLSATTLTGKIELADFQLLNAVTQEKSVCGKYGNGNALLNVSTYRGRILLRKRN